MYTLYILECADGTLYTGIAKDLKARMKQHREGTGAKYVRGRGPLQVKYTEQHKNRSSALRREYEIKSLTRGQKMQLFL